jgi:MFS family permease
LGWALMGVAAGALLTMPLAGGVITRRGSARVYLAAALGVAVALAMLAYSATQPALVVSLVLLGAATSAVSVSLNTQAAAVERRLRRAVMSGLHALYSVGALVGALVGGVVAGAGVSAGPHLGVAAAVAAVVAVGLSGSLLPARVDVSSGGTRFARPTRALLLFGLVGFCVLFGEGAAANWAAVYLRDVAGAGPGLAAAGFAAFSLTMAVGRLAGDRLARRFGPAGLLRYGGLLAVAGMVAALASGNVWGGVIGLGALGAGLSVTYPTLMGIVARCYSGAPAPALAAVSTMAYLGFLAGPALIGMAAEAMTLRGALMLVALTSGGVVLLAGAVPAAQSAARGSSAPGMVGGRDLARAGR